MNQVVSKLGAMMLIGVLITSVGTTQVFADWDKTVYPAIQGTIPIADGEDYTTKNKISLVDAMAIAENILPNSKALYGKLTTVNGYLVYKVFMSNDDREYQKINCLLISSSYGLSYYWYIYSKFTRSRRGYDSNDKPWRGIWCAIFMCWSDL